MTREFFNKQFAALMAVYIYAQKMPDEGQDVYWEMLKNIPERAFDRGVKKCLGECKFFPTIAELGEASLPTKTKLAPYNPHVYQEPLKVDWREQAEQLHEIEQKQLVDNRKRLMNPAQRRAQEGEG